MKRVSQSLGRRHSAGVRTPNVYSAQTVATFCEVDLKTVHHWAERGKIAHFRTEGRHLRFHRNDVVRFLRTHRFPLPEALVRARPKIAVALGTCSFEAVGLSLEEFGKRLGSRFSIRKYKSGAAALAHLVAHASEALILASNDPSLTLATLTALKAEPTLAWVVLAVVTDASEIERARHAGADIAVATSDVLKLSAELARTLAVA
jgi:excisionase family DNA binding protein